MTNIHDVARQAGVSISTVSLALNGSPLVKEETRRHVQQVVKELGYVPNNGARVLSQSFIASPKANGPRSSRLCTCSCKTPCAIAVNDQRLAVVAVEGDVDPRVKLQNDLLEGHVRLDQGPDQLLRLACCWARKVDGKAAAVCAVGLAAYSLV